jgi:hypothetical protein
VTLGLRPSDMYPGGGEAALTDGLLGEPDHADPSWVGFHGVDFEATVDLGATRVIRRVEAEFLQSVSMGIFLPHAVEIEGSEDGKAFAPLAIVRPDLPPTEAGPLVRWIGADLAGKQARFVRLRARSLRTIPEWHPSAGARAWLFADEIAIDPEPAKTASE